MPSNQTAHYQLSQWVKSDQVKMEDFNADNAKIDAALAALAAKVPASHLSAYVTSYSGNGPQSGYDSRTHTFPGKPMFLMVLGGNQIYFSMRGYGALWYRITSSTDRYASVSWGENSITISSPGSSASVNYPSTPYNMFVLLEG